MQLSLAWQNKFKCKDWNDGELSFCSLILFTGTSILFDVWETWKDKKERSFHNGCITCSRNSKHDNRRRQLRTVLSEFQKRYLNQILEFALESYTRVLQSGHSQYNPWNPRDPMGSHWDPSIAYRYRTAVAQMYTGICDRVIIRFAFLERPFFTNYESFTLFIHNTECKT